MLVSLKNNVNDVYTDYVVNVMTSMTHMLYMLIETNQNYKKKTVNDLDEKPDIYLYL